MAGVPELRAREAKESIRWQLLRAFLSQRGVVIFKSGRIVSVSFEKELHAEEFFRFLRRPSVDAAHALAHGKTASEQGGASA